MTYFLSIRKWLDKEFYYSERVRRTMFESDNDKRSRKDAISLAVSMAEGFESDDIKTELVRMAKRGKWKKGLNPEAKYLFSHRDSNYFFELKPAYREK